MTNETKDYPLNDVWILWFHKIDDNDWTEESYRKVMVIRNLRDYWVMVHALKTISSGMFFLMKEHVFPRWEDINNIDGGCWTFRITKKDTDQLWHKLQSLLIGNTLVKDMRMSEEINGISISPKINNCIFKIWNRNSKIQDKEIFDDEIINGDVVSKA